jgi:hypothetical protein
VWRAAIAAEKVVSFDDLFVGSGVRLMYLLCYTTINGVFGKSNFSGEGNFQNGG